MISENNYDLVENDIPNALNWTELFEEYDEEHLLSFDYVLVDGTLYKWSE